MKKLYVPLLAVSLIFSQMGHAEEIPTPQGTSQTDHPEAAPNYDNLDTSQKDYAEATAPTSDNLGNAAVESANAGTINPIWKTVGWATAVLAVATVGILVVAHHPGSKAHTLHLKKATKT